MTRKIAQKHRLQRSKHCKIELQTPRSGKTSKAVRYAKKKSPPPIHRLEKPDHGKLLKKLIHFVWLRPGQIVEGDLLNVTVKSTKNHRETYLYFDYVSGVKIHKQIYSGRSNGQMPTTVWVDPAIANPSLQPGEYNLLGLQFKLNTKEKKLEVLTTPNTEWRKQSAA